MKKGTYFDRFDRNGWPTLGELEKYFLAPKGQEWSYQGGNDSWGLDAQGLYGTEHLPRRNQVNVDLYMFGNPAHGVYLQYSKWDGRIKREDSYNSLGDKARLREFVRTMHGTPLSVGLFIPFAAAWKAVKEFIETNAELPMSIEWIASRDLPPETFPSP